MIYTPSPQTKLVGGILNHLVRPSVRQSVCRQHGFQSITQVCFGISISNSICILYVAMVWSLFIFSNVIFKLAAWQSYWIFWFLDSIFSLALNIKSKLHWQYHLCVWVDRSLVILNDVQLQSMHCLVLPLWLGGGIPVDHWIRSTVSSLW